MMPGFGQVLDPVGGVALSALSALLPLLVLLVALAGLRLAGWLVVAATSAITLYLAVLTWRAPLGGVVSAYGLGSATGLWSVDWIVFWGVVVYHTLGATGALAALRAWLLARAGRDIRVQTMLVAWAFGALLEGLVGFGYPWAVIAPILLGLGLGKLAAVRVAALANNVPVSYGALGAPVVALAAVTGQPLAALSASIGELTAVLALAPPFLLLYLVCGWRGLREGWPLAVVGAAGFVAGQLPTAVWLGPYLPDVIGALTCFGALQLLGRYWSPPVVRGFGGHPLDPAAPDPAAPDPAAPDPAAPDPAAPDPAAPDPGAPGPAAPGPPGADLVTPPSSLPGVGRGVGRAAGGRGVGAAAARARGPGTARGLVPLAILVVVVVAWTGPWSGLPGLSLVKASVTAAGSLGARCRRVFPGRRSRPGPRSRPRGR